MEEAGGDVIWQRQIRAGRVTARRKSISPAGLPQYQYIRACPTQRRPARKRLDDTSERLGHGGEGTYEGQHHLGHAAIRRACRPSQRRRVLGVFKANETLPTGRSLWLPRITKGSVHVPMQAKDARER